MTSRNEPAQSVLARHRCTDEDARIARGLRCFPLPPPPPPRFRRSGVIAGRGRWLCLRATFLPRRRAEQGCHEMRVKHHVSRPRPRTASPSYAGRASDQALMVRSTVRAVGSGGVGEKKREKRKGRRDDEKGHGKETTA